MTIHSPIEWGWDQLKGASSTLGSTAPTEYWPESTARPDRLTVRRIGVADLRLALAKGLEDFGANRTDVIFLCVIFPVIGLLLGRLAFGYELLPLLFPLASGFALVGPVAAIGLIEMSRQRERGVVAGWGDTFGVLRSPSIGSVALLSLILFAIFLLWLVAADLIYGLTLAPKPPASADPIYGFTFGPRPPLSVASFAHDVFATGAGWVMIGVGICVGFLFAVLVLAISVVSFPLLLDRNVGVETAIRTSMRAVLANPGAMALWGLIIAGSLVIGSVPFLLGLVIVMPVLGHATWHLYRRVVAY